MKNILMLAMFILSTLSFSNAMSGDKSAMIPDIDGNDVLDSTGAKIGEVDRVANDEKGMHALVIIGLDDSQKEVAVPLSSVTVGADGKVNTTESRAQLEAYEDIDPLDFTRLNPTPNADD